MKNLFKMCGVIALAAVIGFSMVACDENGDGGGGGGGTGGGANTFTVSNHSEWEDAIAAIVAGGDNRSYTITLSGETFAPSTNEGTFSVWRGGNLTVDNLTVTFNGSGTHGSPMFSPNNNQTFIIDSDELTITFPHSPTVHIRSGHTLTLKRGTITNTGMIFDTPGTAVQNDGTLIVEGGTIDRVQASGVGATSMSGGTIEYMEMSVGHIGGGIYVAAELTIGGTAVINELQLTSAGIGSGDSVHGLVTDLIPTVSVASSWTGSIDELNLFFFAGGHSSNWVSNDTAIANAKSFWTDKTLVTAASSHTLGTGDLGRITLGEFRARHTPSAAIGSTRTATEAISGFSIALESGEGVFKAD